MWLDRIGHTFRGFASASTGPFRRRRHFCRADPHWASRIDKVLKGIFCKERKILPVHSSQVAILAAGSPTVKSVKTVQITESMFQLSDPSTTDFRVARQLGTPPNVDLRVPIGTLKAGLLYFYLHWNAIKSSNAACIWNGPYRPL